MSKDHLLKDPLHPPEIPGNSRDEENGTTHLLPPTEDADVNGNNKDGLSLLSRLGRLWSTITARGRERDDGRKKEVTEAEEDEETAGNGDERRRLGLEIGGRKAAKVRVRHLERKVGEFQILKGITVDMAEGSVVGIIGPSGSGKSTFLRALNRLWEPPPNTVFLDGLDITSLNVLAVRRRVGMLFQTPALFEVLRGSFDFCTHLFTVHRIGYRYIHSFIGQGTVADNVRYGPALAGIKLDDSKVEEFLRIADLKASFASKAVNGLSVGEAQRVALARTLANNPEVLLLDEPTSALDPISTGKIEDAVEKLRGRGLTIIIVSHSIKQIQKITSLVCVLVNGELVETVAPSELKNSDHPLIQQFLEAS